MFLNLLINIDLVCSHVTNFASFLFQNYYGKLHFLFMNCRVIDQEILNCNFSAFKQIRQIALGFNARKVQFLA